MLRYPLALLVLAISPVQAQQNPDPAAGHAERMLAVIDTVLQHHIDPPVRQQMVLTVCRELAPPSTLGLARRVSEATTDEQLLTLLTEFTRELMNRSPEQPEAPGQALQRALNQVPGSASVATGENHRVNRQVAENRYVGTGIRLSMEPGPVMQKVFESGPADLAGARDGDRIESIDGDSTEGQDIQTVIRKLRGPAGSKVTVTLRQPGSDEVREYTIIRGVVPIASVEKPAFSDDARIAYLRFLSIGASTVHELRKIESQLPDETQHVVMDFRNVFNHDLHHAMLLASSLLDEARIGSVTTLEGTEPVMSEAGCLFADLRLTLLIDGSTNGTAEWVVAALMDNKRATTVGANTAGRGFVKKAVEVDHLVVELATGLLHRPGGAALVPTRQRLRQDVVATPRDRQSDTDSPPPPSIAPGPVMPDLPAELVGLDPLQPVSRKQVAALLHRVQTLTSEQAAVGFDGAVQ